MYINLIDNIIELTCSKVDLLVSKKQGVQIIFEGQNELDYFLVQRFYYNENDDNKYICDFYSKGCDTVKYWTFITATLESNYVEFSGDRFPVRVHLPKMTPKMFGKLRDTIALLLQHLGHFVDNSEYPKK